ncbi:MAG: SCO family protein [Burkholderiaceae bacterium]|jgi:protein SCO1/2|nr:SCO family protein [Burkholderiaceae bacterium]
MMNQAASPGRRRALARLALLALAAASLMACERAGSPQTARGGGAPGKQAFRGIDITGAAWGQDFRLRDTDGNYRQLADFRGKAVLLYFGFTQCPDVCPTALVRAAEVKQLLGEQGARLQVLLVTVDPERDTPEILRSYVTAFDPDFMALRGDAAELKKTAADFRIYYKKVPTGSSYTMDHSAQAYVFDAQGKLRLSLRHEQTAQDYAHDIALLLGQPPV